MTDLDTNIASPAASMETGIFLLTIDYATETLGVTWAGALSAEARVTLISGFVTPKEIQDIEPPCLLPQEEIICPIYGPNADMALAGFFANCEILQRYDDIVKKYTHDISVYSKALRAAMPLENGHPHYTDNIGMCERIASKLEKSRKTLDILERNRPSYL